jgi:hypothetical protein
VEEHEEDGEEEVSIEPGNRSSRFWMLWFWVLVLGSWFVDGGGAAAQSKQDLRILSCDGPFAPTMTPETLAAAFGEANVTTEDIGVGEGFFEKGTVLFSKSPQDRLEIHWRNENVQFRPRRIVVHAEKTRWRTANGFTIGTSLRTLERLNRRPFRLSGFAWDGGGGVRNWSGGVLDGQPHEGCLVSATLCKRSILRCPRSMSYI